ncbi:MAG: Clp protease ClpP, partial [Pseudomonadota bacterium]
AVKKGFATGTFDAPASDKTNNSQARADVSAKRRLDAELAKNGMPRVERRKLFKAITGTRNAAKPDTPSAVELNPDLLRETLKTLSA